MSGPVFRRMLRYKIAPLLFNLILWLHRTPGLEGSAYADHIEFFAGVASVTTAMQEHSFTALKFDKAYDS
eukprot:12989831-Alexandrium_andersonii.AAC.1